MTEEEYFRKNYPDSCYGDRPLSPHWDFFQDGVEFGERQSEKKIQELEKENVELKADNDARKFAMAMSEKVEKQLREQIDKIRKCANCNTWLRNDDIKYCKNCPNLEGVKILRH